MPFPDFRRVFVQPLRISTPEKNIRTGVLRLDELHTVVSGNKWFKLQYYLKDALDNGFTTLATFGGAYSNHIVATAWMAKMNGLKSLGIIRGENPRSWSNTLLQAKEQGMEMVFTSRTAYKNTALVKEAHNQKGFYWINEGGYGNVGAAGMKSAFRWINPDHTHIVCAVGTGTMLAGLAIAALPHQLITGIPVLKGGKSLYRQVEHLTGKEKKNWQLAEGYDFGGYAKHPPALLTFMTELWERNHLPTDIVYTGKMIYGLMDLISKDHFPAGSNILAVHSGGLQGNGSLPPGSLPF